MNTCNWPLGDGSTLSFGMYDRNQGWRDVGGLYIFAYVGTDGYWHALYVGQTESFADRLPNHERLGEAVRRGATHIHARVELLQMERDRIETALVNYIQPPMNELLR